MINNDETKTIKKAIKKFSKRIFISNRYLNGSFIITSYRKYLDKDVVDIEFTGDLYGSISYSVDKSWMSSEITSNKNVSMTKVNNIIRGACFEETKSHISYFSVELKSYKNIKKIKWN
jgi:hypothetical protein